MITEWTFFPGSVAALLYVSRNRLHQIPCVYLSRAKGVVVGPRDIPLREYGWPIEVQAQINKHFGTVFALLHEEWKQKTPSPRAQYVDSLQPWSIEVIENEPAGLESQQDLQLHTPLR